MEQLAAVADWTWSEGLRAQGFAEYRKWEETKRSVASNYRLGVGNHFVFDSFFTRWIGHMAMLDLHVKQQLIGGHSPAESLLVTHPDAVANRCYLDYWAEHLPVVLLSGGEYSRLQPLLAIMRANVPLQAWRRANGTYAFYETVGAEIEAVWQGQGRQPVLRLKESHIDHGRACLAKLGVPEDAWFVALHVREAPKQPTRNASPLTYMSAVKTVVDRGGYVVRLGSPEMTPMPEFPGLVDYAQSDQRSDWMDIFLLGGCRFLIGCQSGPHAVPWTFGLPTVQSNWHPITDRHWFAHDIVVPKRYFSRAQQRFLTYAEAFTSPAGSALNWNALEACGVALVDNSPDEIASAVAEMLDRLEGAASYTDDDEMLQEQYLAIWHSGDVLLSAPGSRISRDFLRSHASLVAA